MGLLVNISFPAAAEVNESFGKMIQTTPPTCSPTSVEVCTKATGTNCATTTLGCIAGTIVCCRR